MISNGALSLLAQYVKQLGASEAKPRESMKFLPPFSFLHSPHPPSYFLPAPFS